MGGGFAGLHTARLLAMRGLKVVLVERQRIGWGASGRNGGFVGPGYALRTGALIERLGEDHARQLYAQSQRGVEIVRASLKEMGRPDVVMGWAASRSPAPTRGRTSPSARARWPKSSGPRSSPGRPTRCAP